MLYEYENNYVLAIYATLIRGVGSKIMKIYKINNLNSFVYDCRSVVLVKKSNCELRFYADYRKSLQITQNLNTYADIPDSLEGSKYFTTHNLRRRYWQNSVVNVISLKPPSNIINRIMHNFCQVIMNILMARI